MGIDRFSCYYGYSKENVGCLSPGNTHLWSRGLGHKDYLLEVRRRGCDMRQTLDTDIVISQLLERKPL